MAAFVLPKFVKADGPLSFVKEGYNGVVIKSAFAANSFLWQQCG